MKNKFIPINELLAQTKLNQFVNYYGFETEIRQKGNEERIRNPFACEKCQGNQQAVSVNWPAQVWTSHCYHCNVRGRVTTLLFGMKYGRQPAGGKLTGDEFKDIAADVARVAGFDGDNQSPAIDVESQQQMNSLVKPERKTNIPLAKNSDERIANLVYLSDDLICDPAAMSGRAQAYVGSRQYMTPEVLTSWGAGYLPSNQKSMLRGRFVYTLRNERSEKIGYVGRDLNYKEKLRKWENSNRQAAPPIKAKFPPGFARGSFLYGAEVKRLESEAAKAQLEDIGILVVEGMNDTIALDHYGVLAVGLCSNRLAEGQIEKLVRWSSSLANGRITLMLDNDKEGAEGAIHCMEKLAPHAFVRLAWIPETAGGAFRDKQPEELSQHSLLELLTPISITGATVRTIIERVAA
ncbi:MAG: toprim domain-containing protein [Planctomycetota bacterium]